MAVPDVARALGDLEGTVRSMADQWRRQEEAAVVGRRALYERFEGLSRQVTSIQHTASDVQQDVAEIKNEIDEKVMPTIAAYNQDLATKAGSVKMARWIWAVILPLCTLVGFAIHEALLYLRAGGH